MRGKRRRHLARPPLDGEESCGGAWVPSVSNQVRLGDCLRALSTARIKPDGSPFYGLKIFVRIGKIDIPNGFVGIHTLNTDLTFERSPQRPDPHYPKSCFARLAPYLDGLAWLLKPLNPRQASTAQTYIESAGKFPSCLPLLGPSYPHRQGDMNGSHQSSG